MSIVIERIQELRRRRQGRYFDLCREAGACDASGNGRELTHDDLKDLDQVSRELGKSERALTDDLAAARSYYALSTQLAKAEDVKLQAEKQLVEVEKRIENVRAEIRQIGGIVLNGPMHSESVKLSSQLTALQSEHKQARAPLGRVEVARRQLDELRARCPWLEGANAG